MTVQGQKLRFIRCPTSCGQPGQNEGQTSGKMIVGDTEMFLLSPVHCVRCLAGGLLMFSPVHQPYP